MPYAIMRMNKLKGGSDVAKSLNHNFRDKATPNADPERSQLNIHMATGTDAAMGMLRKRLNSLDRTPRKDAVTCVEYLMTASPEWFAETSEQQHQEFFNGCKEWLASKYGNENIISFSVHLDETTPHISAHVVPITKDGRLSAFELIGSKKQMQDDQTSFAVKHEHLGLERGVKGSKAEHQDIKSYYAGVNRAHEEEKSVKERFYEAIPDKKPLEKSENYRKRLAESLNDEFKTLQQKASQTTNFARAEAKAKKLAEVTQRRNNALEMQKKKVEDDLKRAEGSTDILRGALIHAMGSKKEAAKAVEDYQTAKKKELQNSQEERHRASEHQDKTRKNPRKDRGFSR